MIDIFYEVINSLPEWAQCLLCLYFILCTFIPTIFNITMFVEEEDPWKLVFGCAIEVNNALKNELNAIGLFIAVGFIVLLTLPASILCGGIGGFMTFGYMFGRLYVMVFRKRDKYD